MNEDQSILVLTNTDLDEIGVGVSVWVGPDGQSVAAGWVPGPAGNLCHNNIIYKKCA